MINDCVKSNSVFGVNFTEKNNFSQIGCSAEVSEIVDSNIEGEMSIIVKGKRRYKTLSRNIESNGLMFSEIKYLESVNVNYDEEKFSKAINLYNDLVLSVYKGKIKTINKFDIRWKDGSHSISFHIAQKCGLDLYERQKLLAIDIENDRLTYVLKYLKSVVGKIKDAEKVNAIIKSDGYIQ